MQVLSKAVGIDLGTTNSVVALMNPEDKDIILHRDKNGRATTPSCVWCDPQTGKMVVGHLAYSRRGSHPAPVCSIKRLMGQQAKVKLNDREMSPEEVSAEILKEMKRQIEEDAAALSDAETKWIVDRAIVTVPAYFDQPQVQATKKAAELAGVAMLELLAEPTAAACYHCWRTNTRDGVFLVYDLGGGTFDVTVLKATAGSFTVLGLSGNTMLGGDDMDAAIAEQLLARLKGDYALELKPHADPEDHLRFELLKFIGEGVKKELSNQHEFVLRNNSLHDKQGRTVIIDTVIERSDLESWIRPIVERTLPYCDEALQMAKDKAGVSLSDIDAIILAGGSTHIPLVREMVKARYCADPKASGARAKCVELVYEKVDTIVALGAAIRASATGGLAVYNPERTVRVSFRGTAVTGATETIVSGRVEALAGQSLSGGHLRLRVTDMDYEEEQDLGKDGSFTFRNVPLDVGMNNRLAFEICSASGDVVATVRRPIVHSRTPVRPDGGRSGTATLPKAICMDVNVGNRVQRQELLAALQSLPTRANFARKHPGDTDQLRIKLYQRRLLIKEIIVPVPTSLPRGTEIQLTLSVDEFSFITVHGKVGDHPFEASVVPPPDRDVPTEEEVAKVEQDFQEALQYLNAGEQAVERARFLKSRNTFEAAKKQGDRRQMVHEFEELEDRVAAIARAESVLQPPKGVFDNKVKDTNELIHQAVQLLAEAQQPADPKEWSQNLDIQRQAGEQAYKEGNQKALGESLVMIESLRRHIYNCVRPYLKPGDFSPGQRAQWSVEAAQKEIGEVRDMATASGHKRFLQELSQMDHRLGELEPAVAADPQRVSEQSQNILKRLKQMSARLLAGHTDDDIDQIPWE
jgi:molecular chaperone DnaK